MAKNKWIFLHDFGKEKAQLPEKLKPIFMLTDEGYVLFGFLSDEDEGIFLVFDYDEHDIDEILNEKGNDLSDFIKTYYSDEEVTYWMDYQSLKGLVAWAPIKSLKSIPPSTKDIKPFLETPKDILGFSYALKKTGEIIDREEMTLIKKGEVPTEFFQTYMDAAISLKEEVFEFNELNKKKIKPEDVKIVALKVKIAKYVPQI